jgi:histidinol phosphatase-like PHP family hydrolase
VGWASGHVAGFIPSTSAAASELPKRDFPLFDLHVHPSGRLSIAQAGEIAKQKGMAFGMVDHLGPRDRIRTNKDLKQYIEAVRNAGMYVGMQPTFPGWRRLFDKKLYEQLDYILMDALEIPNPDGSRWLIWRDDTEVDDKEAFMDRYLDFYLQIITTENIDVLAATAYLPPSLQDDYDTLWNEKRMRTLIDAAVKHKVALEITQYYQRPTARFVRMAKAAGAKFTFGTNSRTERAVGYIPYCIKIAQECSLTANDMWLPQRRKAADEAEA